LYWNFLSFDFFEHPLGMDSIPLTIYCSGPHEEGKKHMLARLVRALAQCGLRVGVLRYSGDGRAANSDDALVVAGAAVHVDLCAGTIAAAPCDAETEHCEENFFTDCHVLLVDTAHCDRGSVAVIDIRDGLFTGFGSVSADAAAMAGLIRHSMLHPRISAAVLAGGRSSRLGRNKALLPLGGKTVIETVLGEVSSCVDSITIITNSPEDFTNLGYPCRADLLPGGGPLSGIHAALTHCGTDYVLVVSCDIPLVSRTLFDELIAALPGNDIVIFKHSQFEPLCALYRRTCIPPLEDLIAHGEYRIIDLFPTLQVKVVRIGSADIFKSINTEADYESVRNALSDQVRRLHEPVTGDAAVPCGRTGSDGTP
jgi:molybdopterin-guanine dinucleotide biosynthesis protein A